MQEKDVVAIDLGNGTTSFIAGNGRSGSFASLVAQYNGSSGLGGEFGKSFFKTSDHKRYLIGEDCREEGAKTRSTDSSFYSSPEIRVLFLKALALADIKNPAIVSGLPTEFFNSDLAAFEKNLKKWAIEEGYKPSVVKILPQWAGAWFDDELADENGIILPRDFVTKGKFGVIDIGQGTTDVGQFVDGKVSDRRYGESKGVSDIHRAFFTQLQHPDKLNELLGKKDKKLPKEFALDSQTTEFSMDTWLRNGYISWRGEQIDTRALSLPACMEFANDLLPRCINKVWGTTDFLNGMILAGGGPIVLGRDVLKQFINCPIYMSASPDLSIVRGYKRFFLTQMLSRGATA
jgi:hypothetical protein